MWQILSRITATILQLVGLSTADITVALACYYKIQLIYCALEQLILADNFGGGKNIRG